MNCAYSYGVRALEEMQHTHEVATSGSPVSRTRLCNLASTTVKPVLCGHSKIVKTDVLKTNGS